MKKYISVGAVLVVCLLVLSGCTEQQRKDNGQIDPDVRDEQVDTNTNELLEQAISDAILSHNKDVFRDGDRQTFTTEYHEVIKVVSSENTVEVYLLALYAQYQYEDGEADLTGASISVVNLVLIWYTENGRRDDGYGNRGGRIVEGCLMFELSDHYMKRVRETL